MSELHREVRCRWRSEFFRLVCYTEPFEVVEDKVFAYQLLRNRLC